MYCLVFVSSPVFAPNNKLSSLLTLMQVCKIRNAILIFSVVDQNSFGGAGKGIFFVFTDEGQTSKMIDSFD